MKRTIFTLLLLFSCASIPIKMEKNVDCKCNNTDDTICLARIFKQNKNIVFNSNQVCTTTDSIELKSDQSITGNNATIQFKLNKQSSGFIANGTNINLTTLNIAYFPYGPRKENAIIRLLKNAKQITIAQNKLNGNGVYQGILSDQENNTDINIIGNTLENAAYGILVNAHYLDKSNPAVYQANWRIEGNKITQITADAIEINSPVGKTRPEGTQMKNFEINSNTLQAEGGKTSGAGFCLGIAGLQGGQILNNRFSQCKWQCLHIEDHSSDILVKNNSCDTTIGPKPDDKSKWDKNDSAGIILLGTVHDIKIVKNTVRNTAGFGIELTGSSSQPDHHTTNTLVAANKIESAGAHAIFVGGTATQELNAKIGNFAGYDGNITINSGNAVGSAPAGEGSIAQSGGLNVSISGNLGN